MLATGNKTYFLNFYVLLCERKFFCETKINSYDFTYKFSKLCFAFLVVKIVIVSLLRLNPEMSDHSPAGFNLSSNSRLIFLVLFSVCRPRLSRQVRYVLSLLRNLYHAFVERVSVFAAWWSTASAVLWPPVGRKWTHHRERGMEYQADILL